MLEVIYCVGVLCRSYSLFFCDVICEKVPYGWTTIVGHDLTLRIMRSVCLGPTLFLLFMNILWKHFVTQCAVLLKLNEYYKRLIDAVCVVVHASPTGVLCFSHQQGTAYDPGYDILEIAHNDPFQSRKWRSSLPCLSWHPWCTVLPLPMRNSWWSSPGQRKRRGTHWESIVSKHNRYTAKLQSLEVTNISLHSKLTIWKCTLLSPAQRCLIYDLNVWFSFPLMHVDVIAGHRKKATEKRLTRRKARKKISK